METFDQPLGFGITGLQIHTLALWVPRNAWHAAVSSGWRAHHRPTAPSPSHTSTLGTAPNVERCCHHPAYSLRRCVSVNLAPRAHREYPYTMVAQVTPWRVRTWPCYRHNDIGGARVALPDLTGHICRATPDPAANTAAATRTRPLSVRTNTTNRSFGDHRPGHPRIVCQQLPDPAARPHLQAGPSPHAGTSAAHRENNADFTVFREIFQHHAISKSGNHRSDRRNRRISAQSSTLNTRFLLGP